MQPRVIRSDESAQDVVRIADHIAQHNFSASLRFLDAVEDTCQFLAANHEAGEKCRFDNPEAEGLRVWPVEKFRNYVVFFRPTHDGVIIVRVLHGAQNMDAIFGSDK